jgi:hypothetical protein
MDNDTTQTEFLQMQRNAIREAMLQLGVATSKKGGSKGGIQSEIIQSIVEANGSTKFFVAVDTTLNKRYFNPASLSNTIKNRGLNIVGATRRMAVVYDIAKGEPVLDAKLSKEVFDAIEEGVKPEGYDIHKAVVCAYKYIPSVTEEA